MGLKRFMLGVGIGVVAGLAINRQMQGEKVAPERALKMVKHNLKDKFNITGSWIHMIPESIEKNQINYTVYRGGITTTDQNNDDIIQYDFTVDARTGTLLELEQ